VCYIHGDTSAQNQIDIGSGKGFFRSLLGYASWSGRFSGGHRHMSLFSAPDVVQLSHVISEATAPAFVLGAVAGFVSVLQTRLTAVVERIRHVNDIADDEQSRARLKADLPRLRRRARILNNATFRADTTGFSDFFRPFTGNCTIASGASRMGMRRLSWNDRSGRSVPKATASHCSRNLMPDRQRLVP
jgi:hypothetical protein